jgi:ribonucleoside-diphosphate reductase alpha chain
VHEFTYPLSKTIFETRYRFYEEETYSLASQRLSEHVARAEKDFTRWSDTFYRDIVEGNFMPGGRIWYGSGRPMGQLLNCFVLPTEDSREGWAKSVGDNIIIAGTGGGVGENYSNIRPRGFPINGTGGQATGSVSLMKIENAVLQEVKGGGGRRAARMMCLNIDHPDIEEFLSVKLDLHQLNNANISVIFMTDPQEFFDLVKGDLPLELRWQGKVVRSVSAREIWHKIVANALNNGEPGILNGFLANHLNNIGYCRSLVATNPCVTADTWITTSQGARQVKNLIGKPFEAIVDGKAYPSPTGFVQTGVKSTLIVKTKQGNELTLTGNHQVLVATGMTRATQTNEWVEAKDLTPGMKIVLHNHRSRSLYRGPVNDRSPDFKLGWLLGSLHGDGNLTSLTANLDYWGSSAPLMIALASDFLKTTVGGRSDMNGCVQEHYDRARISSRQLLKLARLHGMNARRKGLTESIESSDMATGFLRGWFDADGSVQGTLLKGASVRLSSSDLESLKAAQRVLLRLGVASTIYPRRPAGYRPLPNGKGWYSEYFCKPQYELIIANDNLEVFEQRVGFFEPAKITKLKDLLSQYFRTPNRERFVTEVESVTEGMTLPVYDCSVPGPEAFDANGLYVHNCGEVFMQPYSTCCLGAVVLSKFVRDNSKAKHVRDRIDWDGLRHSVTTGVRYLDDVLDVTHYPTEDLRKESKATRRIGLGVMGLHYLLLKLGLRYSSQEGRDLVDRVMCFIKNTAYEASVALAIEKGAFPEFDPDKFCATPFIKSLKPSLQYKIKVYGIRNCAIITIAPTGTTSMVMEVSSGIEPIFSPAYERRWRNDTATGTIIKREVVVDPLYKQFLLAGLDTSIFESAADIHPEDHLKMQVVCQQHIDNSISKTCNIPADKYTVETLSDLYMEYLPKLKGITIYPMNSRDDNPLTALSDEQAREYIAAGLATETIADDCVSGTCII